MAVIRPVRGIEPKMGTNCFIAENATVIGDVVMGNDCSIWFNAVVRGDVNSIRMGNKVNVQDGGSDPLHFLRKQKHMIGNNVSYRS